MQTSSLHLSDGLGIRPSRYTGKSLIESLGNVMRDGLCLIDSGFEPSSWFNV